MSRRRAPKPKMLVSHRYLRKPARITVGNRVDLLVDGAAAYPAMMEALEAAQRTINLETYIFASDETGHAFADVLCAKARDGVEVNVLCDAYGSIGMSADLAAQMEQAGVRLVWFKPLAPWRDGWGWFRRNHKKILVVDGKVGFIGGMNISNDYADKAWPGGVGWRDTHSRVRGPAVRQLQQAFLHTWQKVGGPELSISLHLPVVERAGELTAVVVTNRVFQERRQIRRAYLHALKAAQRYIYVTNAYFVPDLAIRRALRSAAERGVDVRILHSGVSDVPLVALAARYSFSKLLKAGARIFEWNGPMMHAKTAVVDGAWATVGSCNLDMMSLRYNLESNLVVLGESFGRVATEVFHRDMTRSEELNLETWQQRPWYRRIFEWCAYRLRKWL